MSRLRIPALAAVLFALLVASAQASVTHKRVTARLTGIHAHMTLGSGQHVEARQTGLQRPIILGAGNVNTQCAQLPVGTIERIVIGYGDDIHRRLSCAQDATSAHHLLALDIQYANTWTVSQDQQRVRDVIAMYPRAYAYSIGNEQELRMSDGCYCITQNTAQRALQYSKIWNATVNLIPAGSLRVAGEISPWGYEFLQDALKDGLPGAQAVSAHMYPAGSTAVTASQFSQLASQHKLQAWATEGACGPGAWTRYGCTPTSTLRHYGFTVGLEWWISGPQAPTPSYTQTGTTAS